VRVAIEIAAIDDYAADRVAVTIEILRGRIDHNSRPAVERMGEDPRRRLSTINEIALL
jgi:hypothetical protein